MAQHYESLEAHRAFLTETYRKAMDRLDVMQGAHEVATTLMDDWTAGKDGRQSRIYVGDSALMVTLDLADGEIFADAAEMFESAEPAIKAAVPFGWVSEWSDVKDDSSQHEARRQTILHAHPEGGAWYLNGFSVWLTVTARVTDSSACQVIKIGLRREITSTSSERMVPIFKAVCPGDPVPMAAE